MLNLKHTPFWRRSWQLKWVGRKSTLHSLIQQPLKLCAIVSRRSRDSPPGNNMSAITWSPAPSKPLRQQLLVCINPSSLHVSSVARVAASRTALPLLPGPSPKQRRGRGCDWDKVPSGEGRGLGRKITAVPSEQNQVYLSQYSLPHSLN